SCTPPEFLTKLFYKGYVKRLIALTLDKQADGSSSSETLKYNEVMSIIDAKKNIEDHLELALPLIDDLAKSCNMSPSKFANMFKAIYAQ
ncbi:hypothetical protein SB717_36195, partial [Priestia sp. SIMBA_032]|uniref:hypothetical protein n=1 Tax=Priestia sp. SIMBA_032 TaxID=3085775 RepID=UPI0039783B77